MRLKEYTNTADFLRENLKYLQSDEVRYGLIYGIARRLVINPHYYGNEDPWFCVVGDDAGAGTFAWRTPPYAVGLAYYSGETKETVSLLLEVVHDRWQEIPGVIGHREVTDLFTEKWSGNFGAIVKSTMAQRIYRLDSVNRIPAAPGWMRPAMLIDKDLVYSWILAFNIDTGENTILPSIENITHRIETGELYLWENNGKPVSLVGKGRSTDHGVTIGPVYTPEELRRQGYASSCVADVCKEILQSGYDFCTLYTDLSNAISNSIYMKIGFKPVCDSVQYNFLPSLQKKE